MHNGQLLPDYITYYLLQYCSIIQYYCRCLRIIFNNVVSSTIYKHIAYYAMWKYATQCSITRIILKNISFFFPSTLITSPVNEIGDDLMKLEWFAEWNRTFPTSPCSLLFQSAKACLCISIILHIWYIIYDI